MIRTCQYCQKPLRQLYPDATPELRWAHISAEDAEECPVAHEPGKWPAPSRKVKMTPSELVGRRVRAKDCHAWQGRIVTTSEDQNGRTALHVLWPGGYVGITFPHLLELDAHGE